MFWILSIALLNWSLDRVSQNLSDCLTDCSPSMFVSIQLNMNASTPQCFIVLLQRFLFHNSWREIQHCMYSWKIRDWKFSCCEGNNDNRNLWSCHTQLNILVGSLMKSKVTVLKYRIALNFLPPGREWS